MKKEGKKGEREGRITRWNWGREEKMEGIEEKKEGEETMTG